MVASESTIITRIEAVFTHQDQLKKSVSGRWAAFYRENEKEEILCQGWCCWAIKEDTGKRHDAVYLKCQEGYWPAMAAFHEMGSALAEEMEEQKKQGNLSFRKPISVDVEIEAGKWQRRLSQVPDFLK